MIILVFWAKFWPKKITSRDGRLLAEDFPETPVPCSSNRCFARAPTEVSRKEPGTKAESVLDPMRMRFGPFGQVIQNRSKFYPKVAHNRSKIDPRFRVFIKGWFPKEWFLADVPLQKPERSYKIRCSWSPKTGTRAQKKERLSKKPARGYICQNRPLQNRPKPF